MRDKIRAALFGLLAIATVSATIVMIPTAPAEASGRVTSDTAASRIIPASLSGFDPGNLIEDAVFFAKDTMSAADIQAFLNAKVPNCRSGYTCLKNKRDNSRTTTADAMCGAYAGAQNELASTIIYRVAQACGINPQVLLVTLQKEQALVTHDWPSDWRYEKAMGQGCPDTAGCDVRYLGFFNQVYGAAWQFKRYANPAGTSQFFTWYSPGRTWNILYNPNRNCGSSPVLVRNQATANLYYYTPYQPNASALRAGYGEGDGCGAYGNRNFYNYFTDWFGSTRATNVALVRSESDPAIYLVSGTTRWHITDGSDYAELNAAYGPTYVLGASAIAGYTDGGTTGAVIRDSSTGVMALVQAGQTHRLATCEAVAVFGGSCASPTNVSSTLFSRIGKGSDVGAFFQVRGTSTWGRFDAGGAVTPLYNASAARAVNGTVSATPYAPFLPAARYAAFPKNRTLYAPAQLVKSSNDSKVYLTLDFDRLAWVKSWSAVADYNRTAADLAVVAPAALAGYRADGAVEPTVTCAGTSYFPAAGWLYRLTDPARVGLATMTTEASTCAQFSQNPSVVTGDLAVKTESSPDISVIAGGKRQAVMSWNTLLNRNAGAPAIATVASSTLAGLPEGAPIADGVVVKTEASPDLLFVSGTTASWIPSSGVAADLGIALRYVGLSNSQSGALTKGPELGLWVACNGQTYFGASGRLWPTTATAASGFSPLALSNAACATLVLDGSAPLPIVAVKTSSSPDVYVAEAGVYRVASSWAALVAAGGGTAPAIKTISAGSFARLTVGATLQ